MLDTSLEKLAPFCIGANRDFKLAVKACTAPASIVHCTSVRLYPMLLRNPPHRW
jgi:hypothetical protein